MVRRRTPAANQPSQGNLWHHNAEFGGMKIVTKVQSTSTRKPHSTANNSRSSALNAFCQAKTGKCAVKALRECELRMWSRITNFWHATTTSLSPTLQFSDNPVIFLPLFYALSP